MLRIRVVTSGSAAALARGAGRLVDLGGRAFPGTLVVPRRRRPAASISSTLADDWARVGGDLARGVRSVKTSGSR
jgi:hypothetical protein